MSRNSMEKVMVREVRDEPVEKFLDGSIYQELASMRASIEGLQHSIEHLRSVIEPICDREPSICPSRETNPLPESKCEVSHMIRDLYMRIRDSETSIRELTSRLYIR